MNLSTQLAKHFRDVHFGGNWTSVNLKEVLSDITVEEANTKIGSLNTIGTLVFHINYYVDLLLKVLRGGPLNGHDKLSFIHPPITSEAIWEQMVDKALADAEAFGALVEQLPESRIWEDLADPKYGSYLRNLFGLIEHTHYHLGQIVVLKKVIREKLVKGA